MGQWKEALEKGLSFEIEMPLRRASDGMYRWFIVRGQPLKNEQGNVEQWFGIAMDIHERKQSEQALSDSEERLQLALKAAHMIAWEFNPQTAATTRSENSLALLGIHPGPDRAFMTGIHPEDHQKVEGFLKRIQTSGSDSIECRYVMPGGEVRWLRARGEQAAPDRIVGVTFDISEHKEAEEEIWRSANHDALTGLPNRNLFQHRLEAALAQARTGRHEREPAPDRPRRFQGHQRHARSRCRRCSAAGNGSPPVCHGPQMRYGGAHRRRRIRGSRRGTAQARKCHTGSAR